MTATDGSRETSPQATASRDSSWRRTAHGVLIGWMVFSFAMGGLTKLYWGDSFFGGPYSVKFVEWGYPAWFRFVVGAGELVAAALLLDRRWRFPAAVMLVTITAGATLTHVVNADPINEATSAPIHLILSAIVAYVANPALVKALFTPAEPASSRTRTTQP